MTLFISIVLVVVLCSFTGAALGEAYGLVGVFLSGIVGVCIGFSVGCFVDKLL